MPQLTKRVQTVLPGNRIIGQPAGGALVRIRAVYRSIFSGILRKNISVVCTGAFYLFWKNGTAFRRVCIRQYPKNTQKSALQGRNESTDRRVRTLFLYIPIKLQSAHWFFQKIFCKMKAPKNAGGFTMKSIYEKADGTYTRQGDYELPNLKIPPDFFFC